MGAMLIFFFIRDELLKVFRSHYLPDLSLTWQITSLFIVFAIITGLVAGALPAFYFSRLNPIQAIKGTAGKKFVSGVRLRKGLTIFQFILSFGFIVSLIVYVRQYQYSINYDFGFQRENILDVKLQGVDPALFKSEFSKLASVHSISTSSDILGMNFTGQEKWIKESNPSDSLLVRQIFIDREYLDVFQLQLLAGKNFSDGVWRHETEIIVNEQFLKHLKVSSAGEAIDKVFLVDSLELKIVGVLKDFHFRSLRTAISPLIFRMNPGQANYAYLKVSFTDAYSSINEMEKVWNKLNNRNKFDSRFFDDELNDSYGFYLTMLKIIAFLGVFAISISLLGMLGMVVYSSETRAKEVGIRKVFGASVAGIIFLLSKDYLKLMGWAFLISVPLSVLIIDRILSSTQYYSVQLTVWDILAGMITLIMLGLLTLSSQTFKTASTNPAETLKNE